MQAAASKNLLFTVNGGEHTKLAGKFRVFGAVC